MTDGGELRERELDEKVGHAQITHKATKVAHARHVIGVGTLPQELCGSTAIESCDARSSARRGAAPMKTSLSVLLAALYAVLSACSDGNGADQSTPASTTRIEHRPIERGSADARTRRRHGVAGFHPARRAIRQGSRKRRSRTGVRQTRGPGGGPVQRTRCSISSGASACRRRRAAVPRKACPRAAPGPASS